MNYETFKKAFAEDIVRKLAELGIDDVSTTFEQVEKPNRVYEAIVFRQGKDPAGPALNVEALYSDYEYYNDYEETLTIASAIKTAFLQTPSAEAKFFTDYNLIKENLFVEVINTSGNAELLSGIPHENLEDLAIIYKVIIKKINDGFYSTTITNAQLRRFGITKEQLHEDALKNSLKIRPAVIKGVNEALLECMPPEIAAIFPMEYMPESTIYVATVPDKQLGAGVLAYPGFMEQAAKKLGGSFYVLPSSIHEVILVPDQEGLTTENLREMVRQVNSEEVDPKDQLSNSVYRYDFESGVFELAKRSAID